ncbi:hypothetical protein FVEG_16605, partial [Fusarium verticillioides 7600]
MATLLHPFIQYSSSLWTWPPLSVITKNSCRLSPSSQVDSRPVFSLSLLSLHKRTPSAPGHPMPLLMAQACKVPVQSASPFRGFCFSYLVISTSTSHRISCGGTPML